MRKTLKALRVILLAILILVVIAVVAVNLFADYAVRVGIETAATKTLNVGVSVGNVDLSIMAGKLTLKNLLINNPPGYQHEKLLELKNAKIEVDVKSLLSDVVKIREIKLDGVNVVLEQRGISGNNLQDVIKTISSGQKDKDKPETSGKKLHIDVLEISNITVKVKLLPVPGKADTITLKLSPIRMTNLGGDNKLDTAALSGRILLAIANGVAEQGVGVLPKDIVDTITSTLGKTIDLGKGIIEGREGIGKEIIKGTEDIGKGITEGLKSLLKPKKEE
ncbi:MAG: AsmA family protein [Planctomycetes bacterium]|nr:AsmA family protein [Planctomycetota bacterium]